MPFRMDKNTDQWVIFWFDCGMKSSDMPQSFSEQNYYPILLFVIGSLLF